MTRVIAQQEEMVLFIRRYVVLIETMIHSGKQEYEPVVAAHGKIQRAGRKQKYPDTPFATASLTLFAQ